MRLLLGALLLAVLFAAAWSWQRSFTAGARAERARLRGTPPGAAAAERDEVAEEGWGTVVVGRPSGAEPYEPLPDVAPGPAEGAPAPGSPVPGAPAPDPAARDADHAAAPPREFKLVVQPGQSLSTICRQHYGSGRRELVRALARYNGIENEDQLRAGRDLLLPPIEKLLPGDGR